MPLVISGPWYVDDPVPKLDHIKITSLKELRHDLRQ